MQGESEFLEAVGQLKPGEDHASWIRLEERAARFGVRDPRVLAAVAAVPREVFMPPDLKGWARVDTAFPIGHGATISQPSLVARMTELLELPERARVLEVGTGSGYQAALLARLAARVYSVEISAVLARAAVDRLQGLGVRNVYVRQGDGWTGWPEEGPYDGIVVTCAAPAVPPPLLEQLKVGARMIVPVRTGEGYEDLVLVRKVSATEVQEKNAGRVSFIPMTGEHGLPTAGG